MELKSRGAVTIWDIEELAKDPSFFVYRPKQQFFYQGYWYSYWGSPMSTSKGYRRIYEKKNKKKAKKNGTNRKAS